MGGVTGGVARVLALPPAAFISQTTSGAGNDVFAAAVAAVVSLGVGGWLKMIYAAALIRFMTRPKTVADFGQSVVPAV